MNTNILAAGLIGFLLGGLVVSIAAQLEGNGAEAPSHSSSSQQMIDTEYGIASPGNNVLP
ncbi:hypothetical protein [Arthrobacter sp. K5]|uniref:Uncharacterized protein n=1 Tax=Arthrobacter sp. K5 TaxID=2839623 RepID=A0AAU8EMI1_9MICC